MGDGWNRANGEGAGVNATPGAQFSQPTRLPAPGMCIYHPQIPATYVCSKCGRSICNSCVKMYGPLRFCPQCNPFPGQAPAAPPPLLPRSRGLFTAGVIGAVIFAAISILYGAIDVFWLLDVYIDLPTIIWKTLSVLFITGTLLASVGTFGFTKFYRLTFGLVSFIFGITASIIYILMVFAGELYLIINVLFGIMLILLGVSVFLAGKHTGKQGVCNVGGIFLILSGSFYLVLYLPYIGLDYYFLFPFEEFIIAAAGLIMAYIFMKASVESQYSPAYINQQPYTQPAIQPPAHYPTQAGPSVEDRLRLLNKVYADGMISDEDYLHNFQEIQNQR